MIELTFWQSVYLVSFPTIAVPNEKTSIVSIVDLISHLTPEARVFQHRIFSNDSTQNHSTLFSNHDAAKRTEHSSPPPTQRDSPPLTYEPIGLPGTRAVQEGENEVGLNAKDTRAASSMGVEAIKESKAGSRGMVGKSINSIGSGLFSQFWLEREALALLQAIQKNAVLQDSMDEGRLLLAGFGFGGIVVKKVKVSYDLECVSNTNL